MLVGGGLVLSLYILDKKFIRKEELSLEGVAGSFCLGAIGGKFADILDPPISPNHREFFHSVTLAAVVLFGKDRLYQLLDLDEKARKHFDWFLSSYASHLILDVQTVKGLPII
jgi:membrane-bound metal-dependent hydrolase YbcI (DUF457 family)